MTFEQILEMDDDEEEREFSKSIVFGFFEQAEQTFEEMKDALFVLPFSISPFFLASLNYFPLTSPLHPSNRRRNTNPMKKNTN